MSLMRINEARIALRAARRWARTLALAGVAAGGVAGCGAPPPAELAIIWPEAVQPSAKAGDRVEIRVDYAPRGVLAPSCEMLLRPRPGAYLVAAAGRAIYAPYPVRLVSGERLTLLLTDDGRLVPVETPAEPAAPACEVRE